VKLSHHISNILHRCLIWLSILPEAAASNLRSYHAPLIVRVVYQAKEFHVKLFVYLVWFSGYADEIQYLMLQASILAVTYLF